MNKKPGILLDRSLLRHAIEGVSLENPDRLRSIYRMLDDRAHDGRFTRIPPMPADAEAVEAVHSRFYLDQLRSHAQSSDPFSYDRDTYVMSETVDCAFLAAGGCMQMADAIMAGEIDRGFAVIRPPGHHAEPGRGMGFCVLNNAAIIAAWLRARYGLSRILLFDFDIHHGNGTQEAFYESKEILFFSIHQRNLFPFSGSASELGEGAGAGYSINVPVYPQYGDVEYTYLTGQILQALVEQYMPQFILVSAGFDGHRDDPISKTQLTTRWFATITHLIRRLAQEHGENRVLMLLEGGYNPAALQSSVMTVLHALEAPVPQSVGILYSQRAAGLIANHPARQYWTF